MYFIICYGEFYKNFRFYYYFYLSFWIVEVSASKQTYF